MGPVNEAVPDKAVWIRNIDCNHPGVTPASSDALCEAASVCLARHHVPPKEFTVTYEGQSDKLLFQWELPSQRAKDCHAYKHDATKDGAYAISFLCLEYRLRLVAIAQAQAGSGADWYVAPIGCGLDASGAPNLDDPNVLRLEVSGTDVGHIGYRMRLKQQQLLDANSSIPAIASVVGFQRAAVRIEHAVTQGVE